MYFSSEFDGSSLSEERSVSTLALSPNWTEPALIPGAMGVRAALDQERTLLALSDHFSDENHGPDTPAVMRVLRNHHLRLRDNIALLGQHGGVPPSTANAEAERTFHDAVMSDPDDVVGTEMQLRALLAQHLKAVTNIETLIAQRPDEHRSEMILTEVARNHRAMAWMLNGLISENAFAHDAVTQPIIAGLRSRAANRESETVFSALLPSGSRRSAA